MERSRTAIDPPQRIGIVLTHPGDKNKDVARVGHPDSVQIHKHQNRWSTTGTQVGIVLSHPSDKNKNVARMGHPDMVAIPKAESTSKWLFRQEKAIFRRGKLMAVT
jgi:hypothetical protein